MRETIDGVVIDRYEYQGVNPVTSYKVWNDSGAPMVVKMFGGDKLYYQQTMIAGSRGFETGLLPGVGYRVEVGPLHILLTEA